MTTDAPSGRNARMALAAYLRLLAACLEDEAALIEQDGARSDEVLRRFREGVLALSLQDAPLDALIVQSGGIAAPPAHTVTVAGTPLAPAKRRR